MNITKSLLGFLSIYLFVFSSACTLEKTKAEPPTASTATETKKKSEPQPPANPVAQEAAEPAFIIETFTEFPPEIEGCSCYFSNDKSGFEKHEYIYAYDYGKTSFIRINGAFIKFTQTKSSQTGKKILTEWYTSNDYEMMIEIKDGERNGDETSLKSGTIKLTDKGGNTITKIF
ncbi:MAG: hypothetical protein ABIQ40_06425 [Bacteroidia bacterium]